MLLDRLQNMQPQSASNYGWMANQHLPKSETPTPLLSAQLEHNQTLYRFEANVFHSPSTIFAMATLPPLNTFKLEDAEKPRIGFRVVASGGVDWVRNILNLPTHRPTQRLRRYLPTSRGSPRLLCHCGNPGPGLSTGQKIAKDLEQKKLILWRCGSMIMSSTTLTRLR